MVEKKLDGMVITDLANMRYLVGYSGDNGILIITKNRSLFFTDFRYQEQSEKEVHGFDIFIEKEDRPRLVLEKAKSIGVRTLGFESTASYAFYRSLLRKGLQVRAVSNLVEDMRRVKDRKELDLIGKAVTRAEEALSEVRPHIREGTKEIQLAARLEEALKKNGCASLPFDIIVAAGPNSSMPHAKPGDNKIRAGDLVVVDWGGEAGGYFSDMTRTFLIRGRDLSKKKEIFLTVLKANLAGIAAAREGVAARMVDKAARDVIKNAGYGDFFGHGTGHGVGLNVHELPRISRLGRESLKAGMVFTVEPAIYIPKVGGVRIEDMVLVTDKGCEVLSK